MHVNQRHGNARNYPLAVRLRLHGIAFTHHLTLMHQVSCSMWDGEVAASGKAATDRYTFWKTHSCLPMSFFSFRMHMRTHESWLITNGTMCETYRIDTTPTVIAYCIIHMPLDNDVVESSRVKMRWWILWLFLNFDFYWMGVTNVKMPSC